MDGYTHYHLAPRTRDTLIKVTRFIESFPDFWKDQRLRCHEVARAIGMLLNLEVIDGHYGAVDHSWCMADTERRVIIDPYSVGRLPMVQVVVEVPGVGFGHYRPGAERKDIDYDIVKMLYVRGRDLLGSSL